MKPRFARMATSLSALFAILPLVIGSQGCSASPTTSSTESTPLVGSRPNNVMRMRSPGAQPAAQSAVLPAAAPAGAHLTYYGGRVVSNIQVVQVLWGTGSYLPQVSSTSSPSMATFYQGVSNSAYFDWLTEYNTPSSGGTNQHIGHGSFLQQVTITPSSGANGATIDDSAIQSELAAQISAGHLPAPTQDAAGNNNTYYAIFFPHGKVITQGGSSSCSAFCAYHGTIANAGGHEIYYGVHPDMQTGSGCESGCGSASTPFGNYTSVASHEMIETVTDCEVGLATSNGPPLAWYDSTNGEIGDICNGQQGSIVGADGVTYTVQTEFSNVANNCIVSRAVTPTNDFSLSDTPSSITVHAGSSATDTVNTAITSGVAETISLSASGQPSGMTVTFSPTSVSSGASSTVSVSTTSAVTAGTYALTLTGTAASGSHSTSLSVVVSAATTNDFSLAVSPTSLTVAAGASGTSTVTTAVLTGAAETISLAASGAPSGVTVSLSPTSVSSGASSTATVTAASTAVAGTYPITITGTAASGAHTATLSLTVTSTTPPPGGLVNGGFESGFTGWTNTGASETIATSGCHGGTQCAQLGGSSPTNGDSSTAQTFTAPTGATALSFWYKVTCPDTVTYDWATATLKDNTAGTTATVLAKTCVASGAWTQASAAITAGHSYTLTLTSHDDNYAGDPTYTLYDDVAIGTAAPPPSGITNGGFETGSLSGWTAAGVSSVLSTGCHGGTHCAELGSSSPSNTSTLTQTFTAPTGTTQISLWYSVTCPDTVTYDWATVTLKDNTSGTTATLLPKTCNTSAWTNVTGAVTAGHSYTLTLTNKDDNYAGDPTFTKYDDVTLN